MVITHDQRKNIIETIQNKKQYGFKTVWCMTAQSMDFCYAVIWQSSIWYICQTDYSSNDF